MAARNDGFFDRTRLDARHRLHPPRNAAGQAYVPVCGKTIVTLAGSIAHTNAVKNGDGDVALLLRPLTTGQPDEPGLHCEFVEDIVHEFHIAVHRGDRVNLKQLNGALAIVRHNGVFDRIYAKWIGPIEPRAIRRADLRPYVLPGTLSSCCWSQPSSGGSDRSIVASLVRPAPSAVADEGPSPAEAAADNPS